MIKLCLFFLMKFEEFYSACFILHVLFLEQYFFSLLKRKRFFVTFGAGHVLKLITLLHSKVIPALLNICLLMALVLLTVPSDTPLFR